MVPVMKGWASRDDAEAEAVLLSVNRLVETGGWDRAALAAAVRQAQEAVDLTTLGFGQAEVERLLAGERAAVDRARARNPDSGSEASGAYAFRQIVLGYGGEEYAEVLAGLDAVRGELGVESNTEAALAVLREAAGEAT
jgi:hypothetical protein